MTSINNNATPVMPRPEYALAYEGSPMTQVSGDRFQWITELNGARDKISHARQALRTVRSEPVPATRAEASWALVSNLDDARRAVAPYMNHDPSTPGFARNEVPRYLPDGAVHADDLGKANMNFDGSVQMHQETILHRLPATDVQSMNWQSVRASLDTSTKIDDLLVWGSASTQGMPDVPRALRELEQMDGQFAALVQNQGAPVSGSGVGAKLAALPTGVKVAGAAAALLVTGGIGVAFATRDRS
ncbi:MAG: hypothetical protein JWO69_850 [Thermoleophilia bacterium]|nr:hypothetical protein [Thermoleophilia bacterium]